ncbi:DNA mismatch repair protein Mlh3-like isoform X2 [Vespa mandarinia]|uniref:DNA mismatch repair protein Mlh3-like isoform X2 n=1 Tax=Vespa mandarinia TaxID=7446 RepID=UPI00161CF1AD|nr:DNA mismatch repair protein Mlh3-like isoform X2 [Vespa mandarinia]
MEIIEIPPVALNVFDTVLNSLNERASCIAIRIYNKEKKIQVVDNGIGISVHALAGLEDTGKNNIHDSQLHYNLRYDNLRNIFKNFSVISISSRCQNSVETNTKIYRKGLSPIILKVTPRPSIGTTVTIYNYSNTVFAHKQTISMVCFLIANISLNNPKISFSLRDEDNIFLQITKDRESKKILQMLYEEYILQDYIWAIPSTNVLNIQYHGYIGLIKTKEKALHYIFLNNRPVYCTTIINTILDYFIQHLSYHMRMCNVSKETIFFMFFINCPTTEVIVTTKNDKRFMLLYKTRDVLDSVRQFINNIFLDECFIKQLYEYIQFHIPKRIQKINKSAESQKVHNVLPLCLYKVDRLEKIHKTKKSILYNTNINHNPITVFYTKYGMFLYESIKQGRSVENYIIDIKHLKTGTFTKKKQKLQNINYNCNQYCSEENITSNIPNNFNSKENVEYINCVNSNSINNVEQTLSDAKQKHNIEKTVHVEDYNCSLSEWSDWSYHTNKVKSDKIEMQNTLYKLKNKNESIEKYYKVFDFLPQKLNNLVQFRPIKLIKTPSFNSIDTSILFNELTYNYQENEKQHQDVNIHPCKFRQYFYEFRLKRTALEFIKVLNQVNNQLIAAVMMYDNIELLLMMDQHAVHERIRYENLLNDYKTSDHKSFQTKKLSIPIIIEVTVNICSLLLWNKKSLDKFGIKLTAINGNTLSIYSIPKCFITNKQYYNDVKLTMIIRNLLNEIVDNIMNGNGINFLPLSIHNAISTEACHGAIKFGELLSVQQCIELFDDLKTTKSPTRCAHGRPSIIPVIELSELKRRCYKNTKKKLNLGRLRTSSR